MKKQRVNKKVLAVNAIVFAVVGTWLGYGVLDSWRWQYVEQNWGSTDGTIETTYVRRAMSPHINWETGWTYSYSVRGQKYEAKSTALRNAYFVHMFSSKQLAQDDGLTRPVGGTVTVYYDAVDPQLSVLDLATDSPLDLLTLALSGMSIGIAILCASALAELIRNGQ